MSSSHDGETLLHGGQDHGKVFRVIDWAEIDRRRNYVYNLFCTAVATSVNN